MVTDKFKFTKEGIVNIEIENTSPVQVFFKNCWARKTATVDKKNQKYMLSEMEGSFKQLLKSFRRSLE